MNVGRENAQETGLAGRYATAMFELARDHKSADTVAADFTALKSAIRDSADLARLIRSPAFSREEQARSLEPLAEKMGLSPLTRKFLGLIAAKRRLFALEGIMAAYDRLMARERGEVQAEIVSARALSAAETEELKAVLKAKLGREPRLQASVDSTLLGGMVVKLGSRMIDSSLRTKLNGIRVAMRGQ